MRRTIHLPLLLLLFTASATSAQPPGRVGYISVKTADMVQKALDGSSWSTTEVEMLAGKPELVRKFPNNLTVWRYITPADLLLIGFNGDEVAVVARKPFPSTGGPARIQDIGEVAAAENDRAPAVLSPPPTPPPDPPAANGAKLKKFAAAFFEALGEAADAYVAVQAAKASRGATIRSQHPQSFDFEQIPLGTTQRQIINKVGLPVLVHIDGTMCMPWDSCTYSSSYLVYHTADSSTCYVTLSSGTVQQRPQCRSGWAPISYGRGDVDPKTGFMVMH